jgi:hypothetical protein
LEESQVIFAIEEMPKTGLEFRVGGVFVIFGIWGFGRLVGNEVGEKVDDSRLHIDILLEKIYMFF